MKWTKSELIGSENASVHVSSSALEFWNIDIIYTKTFLINHKSP